MKTKVVMKTKDKKSAQWKIGDTGYIDAYTVGSFDVAYAFIVIGEKIVKAKFVDFKVIIPK